MNKLLFLLTIITLSFSSCTKVDYEKITPHPYPEIVGTWKFNTANYFIYKIKEAYKQEQNTIIDKYRILAMQKPIVDLIITFNDNMTCTGVKDNGNEVLRYKGIYTIVGDKLSIEMKLISSKNQTVYYSGNIEMRYKKFYIYYYKETILDDYTKEIKSGSEPHIKSIIDFSEEELLNKISYLEMLVIMEKV